MVVPRSGTRIRFFFAASMPFLMADGTSFALPTPKPTTPWPSPTTTSALKLRFLPPLTTLVTRLIETTVSLMSSCDASTFSRSRFIIATLELQSCFARGIRHRFDAPVIEKPVAVEHHALDALFDQPLRDRLADRLRAGDVAALRALPERALDGRFDARRRRDRAAGHVVDHLHVDVRHAPVNRQPRPRLGALHPFPDPELDPFAAILCRLDLHIDPLGTGLPDLLLQLLAHVPHALLLVGIGLAHSPDVRRNLTHHLPVGAGHGDVRLLVDRDVDPVRDVEHDRMRVAEREGHLLALQLGAVADADDVELLLEALGDAVHGVGDQAARQPVELPQLV